MKLATSAIGGSTSSGGALNTGRFHVSDCAITFRTMAGTGGASCGRENGRENSMVWQRG